MRTFGTALAGILMMGVAHAQQQQPMPAPMPPPIPEPRDVAYPGGTIVLNVDATDTERHIFHVKERVPVAGAGPLVLLFPQWLPGTHSPTGQLPMFAGLTVAADGKRFGGRATRSTSLHSTSTCRPVRRRST